MELPDLDKDVVRLFAGLNRWPGLVGMLLILATSCCLGAGADIADVLLPDRGLAMPDELPGRAEAPDRGLALSDSVDAFSAADLWNICMCGKMSARETLHTMLAPGY